MLSNKQIIGIGALILYGIALQAQHYRGEAPAPASGCAVWYRTAATSWEGQVLPLGNGFLGAAIFGGVDREHIQINEHSLWSGGPGETADYAGGNQGHSTVGSLNDIRQLLMQKNHDAAGARIGELVGNPAGFGAYQNFGDLFISFQESAEVSVSSENGGEGRENAMDGSVDTKWFTGAAGAPPFWYQIVWPRPQVITGYTLTSANDMPGRDPCAWVLRASHDGHDWRTLHSCNGEIFTSRHQTRSWSFQNSTGFTWYRFDFESAAGTGLQLAEISFTFSSGAPDQYEVHDYRRMLDLETGTAHVSYIHEGIGYSREYFCSLPDSVLVMRMYGDRPAALSCRIGLSCAHPAQEQFSGSILTHRGVLENGMNFESRLLVRTAAGQVSGDGAQVRVSNADTLELIFAAGTDYCNRFPDYRGSDPQARLFGIVARASVLPFDQLRRRHVADYQEHFSSMALDIGQNRSPIPTDEQLKLYKGDNRALEAVYFHYGRYLLLSSSREGSLPANLQGIWNNSNSPPWSADYHTNINVQMNYWLAEQTNLSTCHLPLIDYVDRLRERGRQTARIHYGCDGWVTHHMNNVFGHTGPDTYLSAFFFPEAAAWLCQHLWEHYDFSRDTAFLAQTAYPVLREAVQFWLDFLIEDPDDSLLVVSPSYSPEHGRYSAGCAMSQQIVWDLLTNTLQAGQILGIDEALQDTVRHFRDRLDAGLRIGSWGQLQEWKADWDDPGDTHRHVSHLFCLHPGRQVSPLTTPSYADAARVSLVARGDGGTGWSKAWKINFWARLHDGNRAHTMLREQLTHSTLPNLWDTHPPFQIDGNLGATAGIAEMLLQSHAGCIHILPALPDAWPSGSVRGLRARGDFELDFSWDNGELTECRLTSGSGVPGVMQYRDKRIGFSTGAGRTYRVDFRTGEVSGVAQHPVLSGGSVPSLRVARGRSILIMAPTGQHAAYSVVVHDIRGRLIATSATHTRSANLAVDLHRFTGPCIVTIATGNRIVLRRKIVLH